MCEGSIPPSSAAQKMAFYQVLCRSPRLSTRRTNADATTPLSRTFVDLSAGGNLCEPHPRPSAYCLLNGGLCGRGREKGVAEPAPNTNPSTSL